MSGPADIRIAGHKRRLYLMVAIDAVAVIAAVAFIIGNLRTGQAWMLYGFGAALAAGFAAQGWMVLRWWQEEKAATSGADKPKGIVE